MEQIGFFVTIYLENPLRKNGRLNKIIYMEKMTFNFRLRDDQYVKHWETGLKAVSVIIMSS